MPLKGAKKLKRFFGKLARQVPIGVDIELDNQARTLQGRAIAVAPELTRKMILSSKVTKTESRGKTTRVVSFNTDYAVVMHEDFYNLGPISAAKAPTQDGAPGRKYLQRPFLNMVSEIQKALGKATMQAARRNRRR